ncbi:TPA: hypothetical protein PC505_003945 [Morganella morganii]|nr:hypothetical protein [Morganella morganii]HDF2424490.1 hypothetical protein [Morganella morganii]
MKFISIISGVLFLSLFIWLYFFIDSKFSDEISNRHKQAEYLINNCDLKVSGVNAGLFSVPQSGYLCNDGVIYYIPEFYSNNNSF